MNDPQPAGWGIAASSSVERDFKELLSVLNEDLVRYFIVGGYAVIKHPKPRYTKDLDV